MSNNIINIFEHRNSEKDASDNNDTFGFKTLDGAVMHEEENEESKEAEVRDIETFDESPSDEQIREKLKSIFEKAYNAVIEKNGTVADFAEHLTHTDGARGEDIYDVIDNCNLLIYYSKLALDKFFEGNCEGVVAQDEDFEYFNYYVFADINNGGDCCDLDTPLKEINKDNVTVHIIPYNGISNGDYTVHYKPVIKFNWQFGGKAVSIDVSVTKNIL